MKITPWVRFVIQIGHDPEAMDDFYVRSEGDTIWAKSSEWFAGRDIERIRYNTTGIEFLLAKKLGGYSFYSFAWDELSTHDHRETTEEGVCVSCNMFEIQGMNKEFGYRLYNLIASMSCIAHYMTTQSFPTMCKGVVMGFLDPTYRNWFDVNGLPIESAFPFR